MEWKAGVGEVRPLVGVTEQSAFGEGGRKLGAVKFGSWRVQIGQPPGSQVTPGLFFVVVLIETNLCFYYTSPLKPSWLHNSAYCWKHQFPKWEDF